MIPIILISNNKISLEEYLSTIRQNKSDMIVRIIPTKTEFSINEIKEIIKEIKISQPYQRIYILEGFDKSSTEAQNAFLKTLEETHNNISFILICENIHQLLPTIISRAKVINLNKKINFVDKDFSRIMDDFIATKNIAIFNQFTTSSKEEVLIIINKLIIYFKNKLVSDKKAPSIIKEVFKIKNLLENNNLNPQLAIDQILIIIKHKYSLV